MVAIDSNFPAWRTLTIHESSPSRRGASARLAKECPGYLASQYYPDQELGRVLHGVRNENLEALTLADESVDMHVTQDVLEHVFSPSRVFSEIARTLKPGGAHIFTVPLVRGNLPSLVRATRNEVGLVVHLLPAAYHSNPINAEGSLVTMDWGYDICQQIFEATGLFTHVLHIDDLSRGIRAEYIEVLITMKPPR